MYLQKQNQISKLLNDLADEIAVPEYKYEEAKSRYDHVSDWLSKEGSSLAVYEPLIYAQGSFALGTAIKPLSGEEYDIDTVCLLQINKNLTNQQELKKLVGNRIKENKTYAGMLDPKEGGRRCWTLKYSDSSKFHLDILPAIPDDMFIYGQQQDNPYVKHSICITDNKTWHLSNYWPKSNPKGYAEWFKSRMEVVFSKKRYELAESIRAEVEEVPEYKIKTPLQKAIQLLKRHRDLKYLGDDDKPISIIITTLAAQAYNNEEDLFEALLNITPKMRQMIQYIDGTYIVANPVNPEENFADKWIECPRKAAIFFEWLDSLDNLYKDLLEQGNDNDLIQILENAYGYNETGNTLINYASNPIRANGLSNLIVTVGNNLKNLFNVSHKQPVKWPTTINYSANVLSTYQHKGKTFNYVNNGAQIPKDSSIRFKVDTSVPAPFEVHWQVVNTGAEAEKAECLRGHFIPSNADNNLYHKEYTQYRGRHWVQAFIVKEDVCVAKSDEFVVNIS